MTAVGGRGVLYVATGAPHVAAAAASAASVRRSNPGLPVAIFCDPAPAEPGAFDHVLAIPDPHVRAKVDLIGHTPFAETLYLDTDTRVVGGLEEMFALLERFALAAAHRVPDPRRLAREVGHGRPPPSFPEHNTGVLVFRDSPEVAAFLAGWRAAYRARAKTADQVSFRDALWASDLRVAVLPRRYNTRSYSWIDAWTWRGPPPVILHLNRFHPSKQGNGPVRLLRRLEGPVPDGRLR